MANYMMSDVSQPMPDLGAARLRGLQGNIMQEKQARDTAYQEAIMEAQQSRNPVALQGLMAQFPEYQAQTQQVIDPIQSEIQKIQEQQRIDEAKEVFESKDPERIGDFMIANPEIGKRVSEAGNFVSEATRKNASQSLMDYISAVKRGDLSGVNEIATKRAKMVSRDAKEKGVKPDLSDTIYMQELAANSPADAIRYAQGELAMLQGVDKYMNFVSGDDKKAVQFGAQEMVKDSQGNLFFATQSRDPNTGEVTTAYSSLGGPDKPVGRMSVAGGYGLTAEEKVSQIASEKTAEARSKADEDARQGYVKQGLAARSMIPKTKKLLELNDLINTGKIAKAGKMMGDFFGVTDPDVGQFNSLAGSLVLENIRALGANPTEGERQFLQQITPSLEQGGAVNEAVLNDMLEIQNRQVNRAKWFANNKGKTVEDYLLETDTVDFSAGTGGGGEAVNWGDL